MTIREVDHRKYDVRLKGHPMLHQNLAWFATEDDKILGVVVRDLIDRDFSWVVLTQNEQGPGYTGIDLAASRPSIEIATAELHTAMERAR